MRAIEGKHHKGRAPGELGLTADGSLCKVSEGGKSNGLPTMISQMPRYIPSKILMQTTNVPMVPTHFSISSAIQQACTAHLASIAVESCGEALDEGLISGLGIERLETRQTHAEKRLHNV